MVCLHTETLFNRVGVRLYGFRHLQAQAGAVYRTTAVGLHVYVEEDAREKCPNKRARSTDLRAESISAS